ncbi:unnamed protein product [Prorocentrum cordatum]|uniref:EF-hand domain-containing protein n=1 Tax=Prorocentrum cordatum TaxID=2364126 RepID=A0ABN9R6I5_9DINO|nr:unnamed protein product [Polarella glacialis]
MFYQSRLWRICPARTRVHVVAKTTCGRSRRSRRRRGEAEYESDAVPCFPVADVNVIGIPSFEDIDVRHDDVIDFGEMALYGFLLCIPDAAVNDLFYSLDQDQDSLVTHLEWSSTGLAVSAESQTSATTTLSQTTTPEPTANGYIKELIDGPLPSFNALDMNKDSSVEPYEFAGGFMNVLIGQHPFMSPLIRALVYDSLSDDLFETVDTNGDGYVSKEEWDAAVKVLGMPSSQLGPSSSTPPTSREPAPPELPTGTVEPENEMDHAARRSNPYDTSENAP